MENNVQSSCGNRTPIILSVLALIMAIVVLVFQFIGEKGPQITIPEGDSEVAAQRGDIVYVRMDTLIMQYDMASDLSSTFLSLIHISMIITENGVEDREDVLRPRYLVEHLHALWRVINDNYPVEGLSLIHILVGLCC